MKAQVSAGRLFFPEVPEENPCLALALLEAACTRVPGPFLHL